MNVNTLLPIAIDLLVKSSGILLLAFTVQVLWRRASAAQHCLVWGVAFAVLLLLPLTLLVTPRWSFALEKPRAAPLTAAPAVHIEEDWSPVEEVAVESIPVAPPVPQWSGTRIVFGGWIAGILLVFGQRLLGAWQVRRLRKRSSAIDEVRVSALTKRLAREFGIVRRIALRECAHVSVPLTWGVFRPVLLLPRQGLSWNDAALEAALRHELGHIRHFDAATRLLTCVVCAVFWPNVLVWLAAKMWRTVQEQACDDLVLRAGTATQDYAMQLLDAARSMKRDTFRHAPVMAMARPSTLETRLSAIMDETRNRRPLVRRAWLTGAGSVVLLLALCAALQLRAQEKDKAAPLPAKESTLLAIAASPQVVFHMHVIETGPGELPARPGEKISSTPPNAVEAVAEAVLTREEAADLLKRAKKTQGVNILSSPNVTTRFSQKATIEVGKEVPGGKVDGNASGFEGIRFELEPSPAKKENLMNLGLVFAMRQVKENAADGKPVFGELRTSRMIANLEPGTTLFMRGAHPSKEKREVIVLLTAEVQKGAAGEKAESSETKVSPQTGVKTMQKAQKIILPRVTFNGATLDEAIDFLRIMTRELDPEKKGLNIILADPPTNARITISLRDVPLSEALHYITDLAAMKFRYDEEAVVIISPKKEAGGGALSGNRGGTKVGPAAPSAGATDTATFYYTDKMQKIIFPRVQFSGASVEEAVEFLRIKSREYDTTEVDPRRKGVNLIVRPGTAPSTTHISLDLKDVPMSEALKYVTELGGMSYRIEPYAVLVMPLTVGSPKEFFTRTFRTPQNFIKDKAGARKELEAQGILFPEGSSASWAPGSSRLIVRNTKEELDKVEALVVRASKDAPAVTPKDQAQVPADSTALAKAQKIIIPRVSFAGASVEEAVEFLRVKARDLDTPEKDPAKKGVNIVIKQGVAPSTAKISLELKDVPMAEALKYVAELGGMKLVAEPNALVLVAGP